MKEIEPRDRRFEDHDAWIRGQVQKDSRGYKQNQEVSENNDPHDQSGYELGNDNRTEMEKEAEWLKLKEELEKDMQTQFRILRRPNPYWSITINDLYLALSVTIPKDFKVPKFIKFDGSTNPIIHLTMYSNKMGMWSKDENFMISYFPESLDGVM